MSWEQAERAAEGRFLKWKDGPFRLQFVQEPDVQTKHWVESEMRYADCAGDDCEYCLAGDTPVSQFVMTARRHPGGDERVLTLSSIAFRELFRVKRKLGDKFADAIIECDKTGSGKATEYSFDVTGFASEEAPF